MDTECHERSCDGFDYQFADACDDGNNVPNDGCTMCTIDYGH